jgi:acyl-CoA synthetase (AMP-forming)/AMP-acid ligase II
MDVKLILRLRLSLFQPLFHMYAGMKFTFMACYAGMTTVILPAFEIGLFLRSLEKYRVTVSIV